MKVRLAVAFQARDKFDEIWREIDVPFAPVKDMEFGVLSGGWFYSLYAESAVYDIEESIWLVQLNNPYDESDIDETFDEIVAAEWGPLWNTGEQP